MADLCEVVTLEDVAIVGAGQTFRGKAEADNSGSGIRLVQIKDVKEGFISESEHLPFANIDPARLKVKLKSGDVLLPLRGERIEASLFELSADSVVTAINQVAVISPDPNRMIPGFLLWYLNSRDGKEQVRRMKSGATIQNVTVNKLKKLQIALPPISVQCEIVEIYNIWQQQKRVLHEMLENGEALADRLCVERVVNAGDA